MGGCGVEGTVVEDSHAVVEGFGREVLFGVGHDLLHQWRVREWYVFDPDWCWGLLVCSARHQLVEGAWYGMPAVVFVVSRCHGSGLRWMDA